MKGSKVHLNVEVMMTYMKKSFESKQWLADFMQIILTTSNSTVHLQFRNLYIISLQYGTYKLIVCDLLGRIIKHVV